MLDIERMKIYDDMCRVLTEYEEDKAAEQDLYKMLVVIQNNWEDTITAR